MAKIVDEIIGNVVKGALAEILTKTGVRKTRRTRAKTKAATSLKDGIVGSILDAVLGAKKKREPAKKQISRRRTAAARARKRAP